MVVVSCKRKYVHEVLVNRLVKLTQGKSVVRLTDRADMTIAVDWDVKHQTKQTNRCISSKNSFTTWTKLIYISNYIFHSPTKQVCNRTPDFSQLEKQAYNRNTRFTTLTHTFTSCSHKPVHTCSLAWPRSYKTWVHSQTQNRAQWLVACGHVSASNQSLRFILSLKLYSSFITLRPVFVAPTYKETGENHPFGLYSTITDTDELLHITDSHLVKSVSQLEQNWSTSWIKNSQLKKLSI